MVQVTPEEMVLEREPIHHGRENIGHGRVCHPGVLDVKNGCPLSSEGRGAEVSILVEDGASKEETGVPVLPSGVSGVIAFCGGDGVVRRLGPGFSGVAFCQGGGDLLEGRFVEEVDSPDQGLEG